MITQSNPPRRVLVIAYYFPPMGLSGVQRTLKFVKYLPQFGWHPTVLTVEPRGYVARDESFLQEIEGRDIRIVRTAPAGPGRLFGKREVVGLPAEWKRKLLSRISDTFFIPDNKVGWRRKAVARALTLHRETPFDLIFATAPPFTDFLIGREVKRRIGKPLVLDYRDPWVDYPFKFYPTPLHRWRNVVLERRALRASSHVVTTNRRVKERIIHRYGFLTYHDIDIIPQGFDPEDFPPGVMRGRRKGAAASESGGKMRVTYAGIFWEDRVPDYFLQAIHDLFAEKPRLRGRIEARFVGTFRDENVKLVRRLGLQDAVHVTGYLPHPQCIKELVDSDVLWTTVGDEYGSPGKTYEYIGARKPILGLVPDGFLKSTILEAGGQAVAPHDVPAIKRALEELLAAYDKRQLKGPRADVVDRYNRVTLTGGLVKIFESLFET
jgi:glycosyltransferase involved in cell wall biosynthesis